MSNTKKNLLGHFILLSVILNIAFTTYVEVPADLNDDGECDSGDKLLVYADADATQSEEKCFQKENQVYDCLRYLDDGTCLCQADSDSEWVPIQIKTANEISWACVPIAQQKINGICTYKSAKSYECLCSDTTYKYNITMDATADQDQHNVNQVSTGCAPEQVPNCQKWKIHAADKTVSLLEGADDDDGWDVVCSNCNAGATAFSTQTSDGFTYSQTSQDITGVGCPFDNTYDQETCTAMSYDSQEKQYICTCPNVGDDSYTRIEFSTSITQRIVQGCIENSQATTGCSTYTYDVDPAEWECNACTDSEATVATILSSADTPASVKICHADLPKNCQSYYSDNAAADIDQESTVQCYACKSGFVKVPLKAYADDLPGQTDIDSTVFCAPTGRWIIEDSDICKQYQDLVIDDITKKITNTALVCKTCKQETVDIGGTDTPNELPCYLSDSAKAGSCESGELEVEEKGSPNSDACIVSNIIDNCQVYTEVDDDGAGQGCDQCKSNFVKVKTQISHPPGATGDDTLKICIPQAKVVADCQLYDNDDLTCYQCTNKLKYNSTLGRCAKASDASSGCDTAIAAGGRTLCVSCGIGFTLIFPTAGGPGVCVPAIEKCASLSASGCSLCVNGYQLVSGKCVKLPANCDRVNPQGSCTQCRAGFIPNSMGNCVGTISNTCPAGLIPSNGVCVPVQVTILFCIKYTVQSKCQQCSQGRTPNADGSSCVIADRPGAKPCPTNTSSVNYRRNPSDPLGDCVAVDVRCANSRDDGFCISCKDNEYAHSDGKCYRIVAVSDEN